VPPGPSPVPGSRPWREHSLAESLDRELPKPRPVAQHPPADPIPHLNDQHTMSGPPQLAPRGRTSKTGADHHGISIGAAGYG